MPKPVCRNCIGFGSGVLGGCGGFCRVFAFAFVFWAVGSGLWARGLWFALGWALGSAGWVVLIKVSWWPYIRILIETV